MNKKLWPLIFLLFFSSACAQGPTLVFTDYGSRAYPQASLNEYLENLKKAGLKHADLLYTCYTSDTTSHFIDCSSNDSPNRSVFKAVAKDIKKEGHFLTLRFYVDLRNGKWRAYWRPKNKDKAFQRLQKYLTQFAELATEVGADQLFIGSEYEGLVGEDNKEHWKKIVDSVRAKFKGTILYAANGNPNQVKKPEYHWAALWPLVDKVAINYYPPFKGTINEGNLRKHHRREIKKLTDFAKTINKELIISEVGFPLAKKGIYTPYEWRYSKRDEPSAKLRDQSLSLFLQEIKKAQVKDIHLWRFLPQETKLHPLGYIIDDSYLKTLKARP